MKSFNIKISLDGQDISNLGFGKSLVGFEFRQDEFKSDMIIIDLWNKMATKTDSNIIRERAVLEVWLGSGIRSLYLGKFIVEKPKYIFPNTELPIIRLIAFDESVKLRHDGEKRNNFFSMTDSQIVNQIAGENGLIPDIENTTEIREQETQLNETDLQFITRLAKRNGFIFYVEKGSLHFHQVRFIDSEVTLSYGGERSNLLDFRPSKKLLDTVGIFVSTFMDKDLGTVIASTSTGLVDAVVRRDKGFNPTHRDSNLSVIPPIKYIHDVNNNDLPGDQLNLVNRMQQMDSYILAGWGKADGERRLRAKRVVEIQNIGHLSGFYYIRSTVHKWDEQEGYITKFFGARARYGLTRRIPESAGGPNVNIARTPGSEIQPEIIDEVTL
jgi:hypothetical protein